MKRALDHVSALGYQGKNFLELTKINTEANSASEALKTFFTPLNKNAQFFEEARSIVYSDILTEEMIEPYPDAIEVLTKIQQKYPLGLVTYGVESIQYKKLEKAGIESSLFSKIVVTENKDKGPSYRKLFDELGIDPKTVLVVGDRFDRDLQPAKKLGCKTVLVSWGRSRKEDHKKADVVINTLNELIKNLL